MAALGHAWCHGVSKTDGARCHLGPGRNENLKEVGPVEVDVSIDALNVVIRAGIYDETVVRMDVSRNGVSLVVGCQLGGCRSPCFVNGVVARSKPPGGIPSAVAIVGVEVTMGVAVSGRGGVVDEMSDGSLALSACCPHGGLDGAG